MTAPMETSPAAAIHTGSSMANTSISAAGVRKALYREALFAAWLGLWINLGLGVMKLIAGLVGQSFALLADAFNSISDCVTSSAVIFALYLSQKPADPHHPYGYSKAEALAGSHVALLILMSCVLLGWEAVERLFVLHPVPPIWTLGVAAANIVIKESLYWYKIRIARNTGSTALLAHAWDHRNDALCSLAVLIGLSVVMVGGQAWIAADEVASLVVVVAVGVSAASLFRQSLREMLDLQVDGTVIESMRKTVEKVPGVVGIEKFRVRKSGIEQIAELHLELPATLSVFAGHALAHQVKERLMAHHPMLRDVIIHVEPAGHHDHPHEDKSRLGGTD